MNNNNRKLNTRKIAFIGIFGALSWVLMFVKLPIAYLGFLEFEFSDVPAIVGAIAWGPLVGVLIELIKNVFHLAQSSTAGVGEIANFITSCGFILPIAFMTRSKKNIINITIGCVLGVVGLMITGAIINVFITIPLYVKLYFGGSLDTLLNIVNSAKLSFIPKISTANEIVFWGITPFNLVKGIIISIASVACYQVLKQPLAQITNSNE